MSPYMSGPSGTSECDLTGNRVFTVLTQGGKVITVEWWALIPRFVTESRVIYK